MYNQNDISIILPAFNEELTIEETILDFYKLFPEANIFVVNNNSIDKTEEIALNLFNKFNIKGRVLNQITQGKANAIRLAFSYVESNIYVMADADCTYQASDLDKLIISLISNQADMVVGDRHHNGAYKSENKRRFHFLGNMLVKWLINTLFKSNLNDIMSGYRVFNKKFVKNYPILSKNFELETEMTLHALDKSYLIIEEEIIYKDRPIGSLSKLNTIKDGFKVLKTILWIFKYYKPMHLFGYLALFLFISSIITSIPVFNDYIKEKFVYHIPLAILSVGFMLTSIISLSIGLILDSISRFHRFDYELNLLKFKNDN